MNDLAAWLLEQIAADERVARAAQDAPETEWRGAFDGLVGCYDLSVYEHTHIKRWLPARVLAECAAKRQIVETWTERWREAEEADDAHHGMLASQATGLGSAVRAVAAVYADRPGYLEEWAA